MPTFSLPTYYLLFLATPRVSKAPYPGHSWFVLYFQFLYFAKPLVSKYHSTGREEEILCVYVCMCLNIGLSV